MSKGLAWMLGSSGLLVYIVVSTHLQRFTLGSGIALAVLVAWTMSLDRA